jgi:hypothetical protein
VPSKLPSLAELAFQGREVPVATPSMSPGDMFLVADETLMAVEFEGICTKPIPMGEVTASFVILTFKGTVANDGRMKSITVMMLPEMAVALIKNLRYLYQQVPIELR